LPNSEGIFPFLFALHAARCERIARQHKIGALLSRTVVICFQLLRC